MKKSLLAAALTGVFALSAHAQSSVTLYGVIDTGLIYTNNQGGHSTWKENSAGTDLNNPDVAITGQVSIRA